MLLGCLLLFSLCSLADDPTSARVFQKFKNAVVMIEIRNSDGAITRGTGFFSSPDGELVTNLHVFLAAKDQGSTVSFFLSSGKILKKYSVGRCSEKHQIDLCLLKLPIYPDTWFKPRSVFPSPGIPLYLIGNPKGQKFSFSKGTYIGTLDKDNMSEVEFSIELIPGHSGGPLFTAEGNLVGVATHKTRNILNLVPKDFQAGPTHHLGISAKELIRFEEKIEKFLPPEVYFR